MPAKSEKLSKKLGLPTSVESYEMPSQVHINLKKFPAFKEKGIGDKCKSLIEGKVTRIIMDRDREEMVLDLTKVEKYNSTNKGESDGNYE